MCAKLDVDVSMASKFEDKLLKEGSLLTLPGRAIPHIQLHNMVDSGEIKESDINNLGKLAAGIASIDKIARGEDTLSPMA